MLPEMNFLHFQAFSSKYPNDDIYKAMANPDLSEIVMIVLNSLKKTKNLPKFEKGQKCAMKSSACRNQGNLAYSLGTYQAALQHYNKALLYAPSNSREMKLAYGNRSALLKKLLQFSACLVDIDRCFAMGCPADISNKLKLRKQEVIHILWMEKAVDNARSTKFAEEFFKLKGRTNPEIPCAINDIGVVIENGIPKVVATADIEVGTVLAVETAYASQTTDPNGFFSCYYCQKMCLTLIPCDGCCIALFCDDNCKESCNNEYHSIECSIIDFLEGAVSNKARLVLKAMLKMQKMSKSWTELETESLLLGLDRMKANSVKQIYDSKFNYSPLSINNERHFLYGPMYNSSFFNSSVLHCLDSIENFFPKSSSEKELAKRSLARIFMFLHLYVNYVPIYDSVCIIAQDITEYRELPNMGIFSFIDKLEFVCNPQAVAVGLNNKIGLVAVQPIKKGTEITIAFVNNWLDNDSKRVKQKGIFFKCGTLCKCNFCTEDTRQKGKLNDVQRKSYMKLNVRKTNEDFAEQTVPKIFKKVCNTLTDLRNAQLTDEYSQVFSLFRRCILCIQFTVTGNNMLNYI